MELEFVKDYRDQEDLRRSFSALAKKTFGIDFEKWFEAGGWNGNYIPYSYTDQGQVVANVSVNTMELIIEGQMHKAIQIGTVMTEMSYRRKGLASNLLRKVLEDFDPEYDFYFLAADEDAVSLYESVGFSSLKTKKFIVKATEDLSSEVELERKEMSLYALLEHKSRALPLSRRLSAVGDEHILAFYYTHGFKDSIYEPYTDVLVIFEKEEGRLEIYDVLTPYKVDLFELLKRITPLDVNEIILHFTPEEAFEGLKIQEDEGGWMIRSKGELKLPENLVFPSISQA